MEGKLRAIWRVSLALALVLSLGLLTAPSAGAANGSPRIYDSAGPFQFTVPAGVYSITVEAWGAGGAGGGSTNGGPFSARGGGGGGGGAYASSTLSVTPGDVLWVVVGAGGVGVSAGNGGAGGPSFVGPSSTDPVPAYVRAAGGSGGTANTAGGSPSGGAGGTIANSVGITRIAGDPGEPGGTCFTSCSGAGGRGAYSGGYGGAKLCGPYVTAAGNPGDPPGGGGGGGRTSQYNGARAGGAGGVGKVVITYGAEEEVCAGIWPITNVYDLTNPGDVTTLITWHDSPHAIASIYDGTAYLTPVTHYTVGDHDGTATLTIRNTYLAGKLTTAGQSVVLTIAFDTDCEATFTITAVETSVECATISPTTRQYDLASPANATTTITWNDATGIVSVHDGTGYLTSGTHYTLVGSTLTILHTTYLAGKLTAAGQSVTLTINFGICTAPFTVTAIGTSQPACVTISPTTRQYNLASPGDVTTAITWNDVTSIVSIHDGTGYLTPGTHYTVVGNTLTIKYAYLAGKLTATGQSVVLTINCDPICATPLVIMALGTSAVCATLSPTTRQYNLASPANATTTITWNDATGIVSIHDGTGYLTSGTHYTLVGSTLTILHTTYLAGKLTAAGQSVTLTINFGICTAPFTVTAIDTSVVCATLSPTTRQYNLASPANATTTITWNDATSIVSIGDNGGTLTLNTHYTVVGNTLTILSTYLAGKLTAAGQSVTLTINFGICATPFVITAIDTSVVCASISPTTRQYNLASPANTTTTITWNDATSIVSIGDNGGTLTLNTHYTVVGNTLTILTTYLAGKLTAAGQSVTLTINFGICATPFIITAIDTSAPVCASISPMEREYNLADPGDVTTLITWHDSPHNIASIYDGTAYLAPGTQYTVQPYNGTARLTIKSTYLEGKLTAAGASVVLTIKFADDCEAFLTITAVDEPIVVGLTGYPVNKLAVVAPWIVLFAALAAGSSLLALRRRQA